MNTDRSRYMQENSGKSEESETQLDYENTGKYRKLEVNTDEYR